MAVLSTRGVLALGAVVFGAFGAVLSPGFLAKLGLMQRSLSHESELVRRVALLEIDIAAFGSLVLAGILAVLCLVWPRIEAAPAYRRFVSRPLADAPSYVEFRRRVFTATATFMFAFIGLSFLYLIVGADVFTRQQLVFLNSEDGVLESASAAILLAAAIVSARIAVNVTRPSAAFAMHGFLAVLFFAMCGEEISWGQRILGFETPEALIDVNVQNEANLHNMFGYFFDHAFILAFFVWGVVVPVLAATSRFFAQVFSRIGLPVPSYGLAAAMLVITLMQDTVVFSMIDRLPRLRLAELREFLSAWAFFVLMIEVWNHGVKHGARAPVTTRDAVMHDDVGDPDDPLRPT